MKRVSVKLASLALLFIAAGCVNEFEDLKPRSTGAVWHFIATGENSGTKVALDTPASGSANVLWTNGDVIKYVTASNDNGLYTIQNLSEPSTSAPITLEGEETDNWLSAIYGDGVNILEDEITENSLTLTGLVAPVQHYTDFPEVHVSVAHTVRDAQTNAFPEQLTFYNLLGLVKFSMNLEGVAKVVFAANDNQTICGDGSVTVSFSATGEPSISDYGEGGSTITVIPGDNEQEFYVAMLPCTLNGFEIKFFDANDVRLAKVTTEKQLKVERSKIIDLGALSGPIIQPDNYINLSAEGTANTYIIPTPGYYKFKATVKGCKENMQLDGTPSYARVLWEAYGAKESSFGVGSILYTNELKFEDGYVYLRTKNRAGSALIAVFSEDNKILWSWHIWVWPGYDLVSNSQLYYNKSKNGRKYYMMDRNLGADQQAPEAGKTTDVKSWGFVYQWGRKDPFIGHTTKKSFAYSSSVPESGQMPNLLSTSTAIENEGGSVQYAIHHPTTYIYSEETTYDWVAGTQNNALWSDSSKTEYDPCPPGWKVPYEYVWQHALNTSETLTITAPDDYVGYNLAGRLGSGSMIFYPCSGGLNGTTSQIYSDSSVTTGFWSSGVSGKFGIAFVIKCAQNKVVPHGTFKRHTGYPVRCMLESESLPKVPVTSVTLDKTSLELKKGESKTLSATVAPSNATYGTVSWSSSNNSVATVTNGQVTGVAKGTCNIIATADGVSATCTVTVSESDIIDLSEHGTANCYVVYNPGKYSFRVDVKGNSNESVGNVNTIVILWQSQMTSSFNTSTPVLQDSKISYTSGSSVCLFETPSTLVNGNVILVAKNSSGTILWSWHIWVCSGYDLDSAQNYDIYNNNAGTVMDRNLGALSDKASGAALSYGLLYQWGRKDPFVGPAETKANNPAVVATYPPNGGNGTSWASVDCSSSAGTIAYSVAHPATFIKSQSNGDWLYTSDTSRWSTNKTMYDPCPPGWRVPAGGTGGLWAKASGVTQTFQNDYGSTGQSFAAGKIATTAVWYPFAAIREGSTAGLSNTGTYGYYWGCNTKKTGYAYNFYIAQNTGHDCYVAFSARMSCAFSVRCVKIQ